MSHGFSNLNRIWITNSTNSHLDTNAGHKLNKCHFDSNFHIKGTISKQQKKKYSTKKFSTPPAKPLRPNLATNICEKTEKPLENSIELQKQSVVEC